MITVDSLDADFSVYIPGSLEDNILNACEVVLDGIQVEDEDLTAIYIDPRGHSMYVRDTVTDGTTIENCREFRSYQLQDSDMVFKGVCVVSLAYDDQMEVPGLGLVDLQGNDSLPEIDLPSTYRGCFEALHGVFEVKCDYANLKLLLWESEVTLNAPDTHVVIRVRAGEPVSVSGIVKSWEIDRHTSSTTMHNTLECT